MNTKITLLLLLAVLFYSCQINNRRKAAEIIDKFRIEKAIDTRETVFTVEPKFESGKLILQGETNEAGLKNELFELLNSFGFIDKINLLPDSTVGGNVYGLINLSVANLRSEPRHSAELTTQALFGTPVKILKVKGSWYRVQTPDRYISWVDGAGIFPLSEVQLKKWKQSKRVIYTADNGLVYKTKQFEIPVSDVTMGNILEVAGGDNRAIKVRFPDGNTGFAPLENWSDFNRFKNRAAPDSTKLRQLAKHFLGRPYLWGGTSARAMDCSGFVKTLFFMNGVILARDASQQFRYGIPIFADTIFSNLTTGDLLFFGRKATDESPERVTHVALSLGGTEYINAAGKIKINSFNPKSSSFSEYRKAGFVGARRIIGTKNSSGIQQIKSHPWY